jgi:hypothetical protein
LRLAGKLQAMAEEFVSEEIVPTIGTFDSAAMTAGAPALPGRFCWRGNEYIVAEE